MKVVGWFQIVVGTGILLLWPALIVAGDVPELAAGQLDIWFHLVAEVLAGLLLVAAGWLLLRKGDQRSRLLASLALGALVYTGVNSAGYYAELGEWLPAVMLVLFAAAAGWAFTVLARVPVDVAGRNPDPEHRTDQLVA